MQTEPEKRSFCILAGVSGVTGVVLLGISFAIAVGPPPDATRAQLLDFGRQHGSSILWGACYKPSLRFSLSCLHLHSSNSPVRRIGFQV